MPSESLFTSCTHCGKQVSKSNRKCPSCGKSVKRFSIVHWIGIVFCGLLLIGVINSPNDAPRNNTAQTSHTNTKSDIAKKLELEFTWRKEGFGSVMEADFKINNNSGEDIKDIKIKCDHYAPSETKIDSNSRTIYEVIKANSKRSFKNFNMGFIHDQTSTSSCYINSFSLVK
ncbi:zinc ribbon domain-containing protein [Vibrio fluvialis]|nr:zinc ribbon domain-containing protein [Vibrio fluvialis]